MRHDDQHMCVWLRIGIRGRNLLVIYVLLCECLAVIVPRTTYVPCGNSTTLNVGNITTVISSARLDLVVVRRSHHRVHRCFDCTDV